MITLNSHAERQDYLARPGLKIDLHSHTRFSSKPTNYLTKKIGVGECMTDPEEAYHMAKELGLTHYTCTDHDTIDGNLYLLDKGYEDVPVSLEVTAFFPHVNHKRRCKVHVLTYDLEKSRAEMIFAEIQRLRYNIHDLIRYYDESGIHYMLAHPFYSVNDHLTLEHFGQMLLLFDHFELNGSKGQQTNNGLHQIITSLSGQMLETLADLHSLDISRPKLNPARKFVNKAGQDAHIKRYLGRSFTLNPAARTIGELFTSQAAASVAVLRNSRPENLNFVLYAVGADHKVRGNSAVERVVASDRRLTALYALLTGKKLPSPGRLKLWAMRLGRCLPQKRQSGYYFRDDESLALLCEALRKLPVSRFEPPENSSASNCFFQLMKEAVDDAVITFIRDKSRTPVRTLFFNPFRTLGTLADLEKLIIPYGISVRIFDETRSFTHRARKHFLGNGQAEQPRVAHFFDTFQEINGPAKFAQGLVRISAKLEIPYKVLTCGEGSSTLGEKVFAARFAWRAEEYPEQALSIPSLLDILQYAYQESFTHFHAATPGPMGIAALFAAKRIFNKPFFVTHHTEFARYLGVYTDDPRIEELVWEGLRLFYNQADIVFALSCDSRNNLMHHGVLPEKIRIMKRGVDTQRFCPGTIARDPQVFTLVTSCRLSKDKGLEYLLSAVKILLEKHRNLRWKFVGDGPYRQEMQEELKGYQVEFTGFLHDSHYVDAIRQSDLFVFPSSSDTFGQTPLEAQACGVPVLVTDRGGPKDNVLDGETGLIVEGENAAALVEGVEMLLDKHLLASMGREAGKFASTRSFDTAFHELYAHYAI
ncbi:MAG: glycosyltransferase [Proteobacteria bacterium]|nr:glycosyltransferase [Pseudomonadota bacterium]